MAHQLPPHLRQTAWLSVLSFLVFVCVVSLVALIGWTSNQLSQLRDDDDVFHGVRGDYDTRFAKYEDRIAAIEIKTGLAFDEYKWTEQYKKTEQYAKDCYSWQKKHPEVVKRTPLPERDTAACPDGYPQDLCDFEMNKKAPNGSILKVDCTEANDPNDFIQ